jgi:hypothetical protein
MTEITPGELRLWPRAWPPHLENRGEGGALGRALAVRRTGGEPSAVGIRRVARVARVAVSWPVRAQPHFHAGTADIPEYLGRCQSRSCNHELARGWEANCKSRYQPRPMVRST